MISISFQRVEKVSVSHDLSIMAQATVTVLSPADEGPEKGCRIMQAFDSTFAQMYPRFSRLHPQSPAGVDTRLDLVTE